MSSLPQKRDTSIDLLRFIGLTLIILAHIGLSRSTSVLFQLRSFDVPLMVFTSGLAFSGKNIGKYLPFLWKRTLRLIVPVYIFVTIYILLNPLLSSWGLVKEYSADIIAGTYMLRLNPSIGYVWIIRVFLIMMLVTPLLVRIDKSIKSEWKCLGVVLVLLAMQHIMVQIFHLIRPNWFVQDWLLYIFGYSAVFLWGLLARRASSRMLYITIAVMAFAMVAYAFQMHSQYGTWMRLQATKYPPRLYFLLWGMLMSGLLWISSAQWTRVLNNKLFTFIGRNTIWIYLWHIPFVNIVVKGPFDGWHPIWKYIFVYVAAVCIYIIQYRLVKMAQNRWPDNRVTKFFVG